MENLTTFGDLKKALAVLEDARASGLLQQAVESGLIHPDRLSVLAQVPERRAQVSNLMNGNIAQTDPVVPPELIEKVDLKARVNKFIEKCLDPSLPILKIKQRDSAYSMMREFGFDVYNEEAGRVILDRLAQELSLNSSLEIIHRLVAMLESFPASVGGDYGGLGRVPEGILLIKRLSKEITLANSKIIPPDNRIGDSTLNYLAQRLDVIRDISTYLYASNREKEVGNEFKPEELKKLFLDFLEVRIRDLSKP